MIGIIGIGSELVEAGLGLWTGFLRSVAVCGAMSIVMASLWLRLLIGSDEFPIWFRN